MQIVPQSATFSYCPFPLLPPPAPRLMLPAPAPRLALPAPRVAGLIPANVSFTVETLPPELGPFRSIEEMDAELEPYLGRITDKFRLLHDFYTRMERSQ